MPKTGAFTPVIQIPEAERQPVDLQAIQMVHHLYEEVRSTMDTERSRQQEIGISEYGSDCRRCVARKISRLFVKINDPSWKAQVGTFIHAGLEEHFVQKYVSKQAPDAIATDARPLYHSERRVQIMEYKGLKLGGSCDLYVQGETFGLVADWKTQGPRKLNDTGKGKISRAYLVQMHTYGFGYELLGLPVTHVVLYALPRDGELFDAKPVLMRYDRQLVLDELADIQQMIDAAEIVGWEKLIEFKPRAAWCPDCDAFERQGRDQAFAWLER
jgi:hypothetical protein